MSIKNEIDRITTAKQDIKSAIEDKGVSVPDDAHIDEYSQYIEGLVNPSDVVTSLNGEMGDVTLRPTYYKLNGTPVTDMGGVGQKYPIAISNLTPQSPAPKAGDTVVFYTDSYTYIGTITETQTSAIIVEVKVTMLGKAGGGGAEYYDTVIGSQEDFEAWYAQLDAGTYAGHSVLFLNGTYTRSDGKGLHLPDTLYTIKGIGNVDIEITNLSQEFSTNKGGIWYNNIANSPDYSIQNISVLCRGAEARGFCNCTNLINCTGKAYGERDTAGRGFDNCTNLINCNGLSYGSSPGVFSGFYNCTNLTNCIGAGNGRFGEYYAFYSCKICSNCRQDPDNPSTTATWGGTNTNVDPNTCPEWEGGNTKQMYLTTVEFYAKEMSPKTSATMSFTVLLTTDLSSRPKESILAEIAEDPVFSGEEVCATATGMCFETSGDKGIIFCVHITNSLFYFTYVKESTPTKSFTVYASSHPTVSHVRVTKFNINN